MADVVYLMGVPCAGKSTVLDQWQQQGGLVLEEFNDEPLPDYVRYVWNEDEVGRRKSQEWVLAQEKIQDQRLKALETEETVLVERCALDVLVYSRALGYELGQWTGEAIGKVSWTPGKVVLMTADQEVLKQRWLVDRQAPVPVWEDHWREATPILNKHYLELQQQFSIPLIDTNCRLETMLPRIQEAANSSRLFTIENMVSNSLPGKERL